MRYIHDTERTYYDELLFHLRKHNKHHTGIKANATKYIYILENNSLQGAIKVQLSWDWISIKELTYKNVVILKKLIRVLQNEFKDQAVGIKVITNDPQRFKEFETLGFQYYGSSYPTKSYKEYQFGELRNFKVFDDYNNVVVTNEEDERYKHQVQDWIQTYKAVHKEDEIIEEQLHVCLDQETFCGGIFLQLYKEHLYIDLLAVNEAYRGNRIGSKLMDIAENIARERNYEWIDVGTTEFQARPFYEKQGYKVILETQDFPKGFSCYTLIKELNKE